MISVRNLLEHPTKSNAEWLVPTLLRRVGCLWSAASRKFKNAKMRTSVSFPKKLNQSPLTLVLVEYAA